MTDQPTAAEIAEILDDAEIVALVWPDGERNVLLKGEERLASLVGHALTEPIEMVAIPVSNDREAGVIAGALGAIEKGGLDATQLAALQSLLDQARGLQ